MKKLKNLTEKMLAKDDLLTIKGGYPTEGHKCGITGVCWTTLTQCLSNCPRSYCSFEFCIPDF